MTPKFLLTNAIRPAFALLEGVGVHSDIKAELMVLAIAGQESAWQYRRQVGGPARSFWQFERGGGVAGLFNAAPKQLRFVCDESCIPFDPATVFAAMAWHDVLAAAMARLLLWTDPAPLPEVGDVQGSWNFYERNWRPGLPHPDNWPGVYGTSIGLVKGA